MKELATMQYNLENPYISQTLAYQEGMSYLYSPDSYLVTFEQFERMKISGKRFGQLLQANFGNQIIEFRLDFVKDKEGDLFITEVQTDDRGLPAIACTRNSRGSEQDSFIPGITEAFTTAFRQKANNDNPTMLLIYPAQEYFYYAGFYDLTRLIAGVDPTTSLTVLADNEIESIDKQTVITKPMYNGTRFIANPDLVWDFASVSTGDIERIQPLVDKTLLSNIWTNEDPISISIRPYLPEVTNLEDPRVCNDKNNWILKPTNGRWSKGIVIGSQSDRDIWNKTVTKSDNLLAQKFIFQPKEEFTVRRSSGNFEKRDFYSRIEGYYTKIDGQWILADILATCTPKLPIHGQRECIMIPGKIN